MSGTGVMMGFETLEGVGKRARDGESYGASGEGPKNNS